MNTKLILQAMNKLLNAESALCKELTVGVETYVGPLREILPASMHISMFLGLTEVRIKHISL